MKKTNNLKPSATLGFEDKIWKACDAMRGHIPAADYRKIIVGLIFIRYVSDAFTKQREKLIAAGEGFEDDRDAYTADNIFFVPELARWDVIARAARKPEIGKVLDDAMREVEKENESLKGCLPKIYGTPAIDKRVLGDVVDLFTNEIKLGDVAQSRDLLGKTYQYCIKNFALHEGQKGGEFYTPECIDEILVAVVDPQPNDRIYEPCCGSAGLIVQSQKVVEQKANLRISAKCANSSTPPLNAHLSVYAQEAQLDTWRMAKLNLAIRGIDADLGDSNGDTFHDDKHKGVKADIVLANPPFNLKAWGQEKLLDDVRWKYGIPPANNANYAWIQHMIHHLSPRGKIGLVLANGALTSQSGGEGEIRRKILEDDLVEAIVALPPQLFYSVQIPVSLWFFNRKKPQPGKTVFIDAREMGVMEDRTHKVITAEEVAKIAETVHRFQRGEDVDEKGFAAVATLEQIAAQDYMLTPGRYVGIKEVADDGEPIKEKLARLRGELMAMFEEGRRLEKEIVEQLGRVKV